MEFQGGKKNGQEELFEEIMDKKFPIMKDINIQTQKPKQF